MEREKVTVKSLVESGVHLGHTRTHWNPKMKRYIFEERNNISIIDLSKTMQQIRDAIKVVEDITTKRKPILFVGTKKSAKEVVKESAEESGDFYVCHRWLGGTLTNRNTVRESIKTLDSVEKKIIAGGKGLTKKEMAQLTKKQMKLEANLAGIRAMKKLPGLLIIVDPRQEHIAVAEANKMAIPIVALTDTNCDPTPIDFVIACNDDSVKSVKLILGVLSQAILEKKKEMKIAVSKSEEEEIVTTMEEGGEE